MTIHTNKIAVSLPASTFQGVEAARRRMGRSRSSVVAEALDAWLAARTAGDVDRRYVEAYQRFPEPPEDAVALAVMTTWDDWDAPRPRSPHIGREPRKGRRAR